MADDTEPVMRVTDTDTGEVFYLAGTSIFEARQSFGDHATIQTGQWHPTNSTNKG